ncbi:MAG TPA: thioredoxin family protein [Cytophagales bacterium]|nr:thioredoxin family protein [Cytophagales bacterium]
MAQTPSNMVALGTAAPDFKLVDVASGNLYHLKGTNTKKATLIMFICNHCPYVKHVLDELVRIGKEYIPKGINVIAISSNDSSKYPEDGPEQMKALTLEKDFSFPYLLDEMQEVARAYEAACTPDFYIYDSDLKLVYRGQLDSSRPKNDIPVTGKDIRKALEDILEGRALDNNQVPSIGCNIKWK